LKKFLKYIKYLFITVVSILLIFILSIGFTNQELKGTWIGEYEVHPDMDLYLAHESVMTLGYFSCFEEFPSYYGTSSLDNPNIMSSKRIGFVLNMFGVIKSNNYNKYQVISINGDSLQVKSNVFNENNYETFRRIDDSLKNNQKINLAGKKFLFSNNKVTDTLHFKNVGVNLDYGNKTFNHGWDLIQHNGFQILFIEDFVPFIIVNKKENVIELKRLQATNDNYKMTEI
jgi:hypothetical protein